MAEIGVPKIWKALWKLDLKTKFRILLLLLIFKPHFLQYLHCHSGPAMDPAVLPIAGQLSGVGGGPPKHGGSPPGPSSVIGNDLKISVSAFSLTSPFSLQLKLFEL